MPVVIKFLQGFGSKVLKKSGWREGSGVGASNQGISEPLEAEGQHPRSKKGLGYGIYIFYCDVYTTVYMFSTAIMVKSSTETFHQRSEEKQLGTY